MNRPNSVAVPLDTLTWAASEAEGVSDTIMALGLLAESVGKAGNRTADLTALALRVAEEFTERAGSLSGELERATMSTGGEPRASTPAIEPPASGDLASALLDAVEHLDQVARELLQYGALFRAIANDPGVPALGGLGFYMADTSAERAQLESERLRAILKAAG